MIIFKRSLMVGQFVVLSGLCFTIWSEVARPNQVRTDQANQLVAVRTGSTTEAEPALRHGIWLNEIIGRPLFSSDRRPLGIAARGVPGLARLTGIVVDGSRRIAIFAAGPGGHAIIVEAGARIGVYDVQDIADGGVTVVGPAGTALLHPMFDTAPAVVQDAPQEAFPPRIRFPVPERDQPEARPFAS